MGCFPMPDLMNLAPTRQAGRVVGDNWRDRDKSERGGEPQKLPALKNGQLDNALNDARADGVASESGGTVNVELLHDMLAMSFDGLHADAQFRRDLFVGFAFGNQLEHFHLARSQAGLAQLRPSGSIQRLSLAFGKKLRNERAEKDIPLVDFPNPLGQNAGGGLFEQKSHGTGLRCAFYIRVIIVRRENEYSGTGDGFEDRKSTRLNSSHR